MNDFTIFSDPEVALDALSNVGMVRVPFSELNSDIEDMLRVYTKSILTHTQVAQLISSVHKTITATQDINHSSLYIFKQACYEFFLQMCAKEKVVTKVSDCHTMSTQVLYSQSLESINLADAETFTQKDADSFLNILNSSYSKLLKNTSLHLVQVNSFVKYNEGHSIISEFLLYVPNV